MAVKGVCFLLGIAAASVQLSCSTCMQRLAACCCNRTDLAGAFDVTNNRTQWHCRLFPQMSTCNFFMYVTSAVLTGPCCTMRRKAACQISSVTSSTLHNVHESACMICRSNSSILHNAQDDAHTFSSTNISMLRNSQEAARKAWWQPGHPGWCIPWDYDSTAFMRSLTEAPNVAQPAPSPKMRISAPVPRNLQNSKSDPCSGQMANVGSSG